ncbi:MAG TPA: hypothetical protein VJQ61_09490 [Sinomonas sp.]|nr:hypothetical protein [Sinomonas sp.]
MTPAERRFVWGGRYEDGTMIWVSRWITATGIVECREALAYPGDPHRAILLRRIRAAKGPAEVRVVVDVRAGFGHHAMSRLRRDGGDLDRAQRPPQDPPQRGG